MFLNARAYEGDIDASGDAPVPFVIAGADAGTDMNSSSHKQNGWRDTSNGYKCVFMVDNWWCCRSSVNT